MISTRKNTLIRNHMISGLMLLISSIHGLTFKQPTKLTKWMVELRSVESPHISGFRSGGDDMLNKATHPQKK
jgi:hypothetical protein